VFILYSTSVRCKIIAMAFPESNENGSPLPFLRSLNDDLFSLVTFISRSRRRVSIDWINYTGCRVQYCVLRYGERFSIRTFVTHPWVFRDVATEDTLVTSRGESIYYPVAWDGEDVHDMTKTVVIGIPGTVRRNVRCTLYIFLTLVLFL